MGAFADLFKSERGLLGILLIIGATVLAILGLMPVERWESYTQVIFLGYALGKTVTGGITAYMAPKRITAIADAASPLSSKSTPATIITTETATTVESGK